MKNVCRCLQDSQITLNLLNRSVTDQGCQNRICRIMTIFHSTSDRAWFYGVECCSGLELIPILLYLCIYMRCIQSDWRNCPLLLCPHYDTDVECRINITSSHPGAQLPSNLPIDVWSKIGWTIKIVISLVANQAGEWQAGFTPAALISASCLQYAAVPLQVCKPRRWERNTGYIGFSSVPEPHWHSLYMTSNRNLASSEMESFFMFAREPKSFFSMGSMECRTGWSICWRFNVPRRSSFSVIGTSLRHLDHFP